MMAESGVNAIEPLDPLGGVKVWDAKARIGNKVTLKGGVNTLTFVNGSVEEVIEETKKCLSEGRRLANATFSASHACDTYRALNYAMDLTPLMDENTDIVDYITGYIERFKETVGQMIGKYI